MAKEEGAIGLEKWDGTNPTTGLKHWVTVATFANDFLKVQVLFTPEDVGWTCRGRGSASSLQENIASLDKIALPIEQAKKLIRRVKNGVSKSDAG